MRKMTNKDVADIKRAVKARINNLMAASNEGMNNETYTKYLKNFTKDVSQCSHEYDIAEVYKNVNADIEMFAGSGDPILNAAMDSYYVMHAVLEETGFNN